jgi:hypothetical protein
VQQTQLGLQSARQEMDFSAERMGMLREESRREAEAALAAQAANLTAEQLAAEKQQISEGLAGAAFFYQNQDRAGYDAFLSERGLDPAQYAFDQFPAHAATFEGALEAMEAFAPATMDPADRYKAVGGTLFDIGAEGGPVPVADGAMQETTVYGPDGKPIMVQGGPGSGAGVKPLTESQAKFTVFQTDMAQAAEVIADLESRYDPTNLQDQLAGVAGDKWGSFLQSGEGQIYKSAAYQWLDSGIRIRTGAAATDQEVARQFTAMFPQPGDEPETVAYKRRARENFERSVDQALTGVRAPMAPDAPADLFTPSDAGVAAPPTTGGDLSDEDLLRMYGGE